MAFDPKILMSFTDLQTLITTEGFTQKNAFPTTSLKLVDKLEAIDALNINLTTIAPLTDSQLVAREFLEILAVGNIIALDILIPGDQNPANRFLKVSNLSVAPQLMTIRFTLVAASFAGAAYVQIGGTDNLTNVNDTYDFIGTVTEGQLFSVYLIDATAGDSATVRCDIISAAVDTIPTPSYVDAGLARDSLTQFTHSPTFHATSGSACGDTFFLATSYSDNPDQLDPIVGDNVFEDSAGLIPIVGGSEWIKMSSGVSIQIDNNGEVIGSVNC